MLSLRWQTCGHIPNCRAPLPFGQNILHCDRGTGTCVSNLPQGRHVQWNIWEMNLWCPDQMSDVLIITFLYGYTLHSTTWCAMLCWNTDRNQQGRQEDIFYIRMGKLLPASRRILTVLQWLLELLQQTARKQHLTLFTNTLHIYLVLPPPPIGGSDWHGDNGNPAGFMAFPRV